jgi:hypothetical protein
MRQRAKSVGAALTFGAVFVLEGGRFRATLDALLIPKEMQDALVTIASAGSWATIVVSLALLVLGVICAGYIAYEDIPKLGRWIAAYAKGFKVQYLIPIGAGLVAVGAVLIFVGWFFSGESAPVASAAKAVEPTAPASPLPDISWNYDKPGWGAFGFLYASRTAGVDQTVWVNGFQAKGHNNTGGPILNISGIFRSDINNKEVPINFLVGNELVKPENTNGVPMDADFFIESDRLSTTDSRGLTFTEFLATFGAFTFDL